MLRLNRFSLILIDCYYQLKKSIDWFIDAMKVWHFNLRFLLLNNLIAIRMQFRFWYWLCRFSFSLSFCGSFVIFWFENFPGFFRLFPLSFFFYHQRVVLFPDLLFCSCCRLSLAWLISCHGRRTGRHVRTFKKSSAATSTRRIRNLLRFPFR